MRWVKRLLRRSLGDGLGDRTADTPQLRSLSPAYVRDQHESYVNILKAKLTETGVDAPLNIALTGHYGSGKSSVLVEMERELEKDHVKVINLSLPSLGIGDGRISKDGDKALDRTNLIQKEIVKQLLYRRKPSDMPASRYNRLDTFRIGRALRTGVGVGLAATGVALIAKLPTKARNSLPPKAWSWINHHIWGDMAVLLQWLSLAAVFGLTIWAALWVQRILQQRLRVTELAAGPTKVTLSDSSSSYFDEYLDEIVYFFQTSRTAVVIFEDLDRFKDPHIFETLRELNLLLNNAEQTGATPIRFVYAIRDSIFEELDVDGMDPADEGKGDRSSTDNGDVRRLMSTNRTKFFDFVVPMVPFISHRTSRDLIRHELKAIVPEQRPGNAVVDIVGAHLTDMRLIKNICNEYEVFGGRILGPGRLEELTADRLFASIVYKNLYLADYEKIRDGTSRLDMLYRAYRAWVTHHTASAQTAERAARSRLRRINAIGTRASRLGTRLQDVLLARHLPANATNTPQVRAAGATHSWADLKSEAFWRSYLQDRGNISVQYQPGYQFDAVSFAKIESLMGYKLSPKDWTDEAKAEAYSEVDAAVADQRTVRHASLVDALGDSHRQLSYEGADRSIGEIAEHLFDGAPLVLELLRAGLIDENFTLYITQFPGQAISASAMNFIIKAVQPDVMDTTYHFGAGEHVDIGDIEAVLNAEASRLLGGQSVYNIEIFDYLLARDPSKLDEPIRRLAADAEDNRGFIDAYLTSGSAASALVQRLSAVWPGVFGYLIGPDPEAQYPELLDAALSGVRSQLTYSVTTGQRQAIAAALPHLTTITTPQTPERASAIAQTIERVAIRVDDLAVVPEPLRNELSTRNLYPVTLANLRAILGDDDDLPLDRIKAARELDVYAHVLDHLRDYLDALESAPGVPTIVDASQYADVLADVGDLDTGELVDVARRAGTECVLRDLTKIDSALWPSIASAHRLDLTARNAAAYVAVHSVDEPLAGWLSAAGAIRVEDADSATIDSLALDILNATTVDDSSKLRLASSLGVAPGAITAASLQADAHGLIPRLVANGLIEDTADAYVALGDTWEVKERLISVSKAFPSYMTSLALNGNELLGIASRPVPETVKQVLMEELDTFKGSLGPRGAAALADWAAKTGRAPAAGAILTMATKGGPESAASIIKLLGAQAETVDVEMLKAVLNALGKPYDQLTVPGRDRPKVDVSEGIVPILNRLQKAAVVSKFVENQRKGVFEISKRRS